MTGLSQRLAAAGVEPDSDPLTAWLALRQAEGEAATIIDLYEMVASPRGLAAHELPLAERKSMWAAVMPARRPGFEQSEGSDRADDPPAVVPYDQSWPDRYAGWKARLSAELGNAGQRIEHVGSTSVPGLAAKPVIDIQLSAPDLAAADFYTAPLERAGGRAASLPGQPASFLPAVPRQALGRPRSCLRGWVALGAQAPAVPGLPPRQC